MSRLYAWLESDMQRKPIITRRAKESMSLTVNYGSKSNSMRLLNVNIWYPKDSNKPQVTVTEG